MAFNLTVLGTVFSIPNFGDNPPGNNWGPNLDAFFTALAAASASLSSPLIQEVNVSGTPYAVSNGFTYLVNSGSLAITLNLPQPAINAWMFIKDTGENAANNNITVHRYASESIDGLAADKKLTYNGASILLVSNGVDWFSITGQNHHTSHEIGGSDPIVNGMSFSYLGLTGPLGLQTTALHAQTAQFAISTKTANYTINGSTDSILMGNASVAPIQFTLPSSTNIGGQIFYVKKIDPTPNAVWVTTVGGNTIDGISMSLITVPNDSRVYASGGGNGWYIL